MTQVLIIDAKNFVYRMHHVHRNLSSHDFPTSVLYGCPIGVLSLAKKFPDTPIIFAWDGEGPTWRHHLLSRGEAPKIENKVRDVARVKVQGTLPPYMQTSLKYIQKSAALALGHAMPPVKQTAPPKQKKERPVGYKANRDHSNDDWADAYKQIPIFRNFLTKIGMRQFQVDNLEGDDLIGILVTFIVENEIFDKVIIHSSDRDFYQFISDKVSVLRGGKEGGFAKREDIRAEFGVDCEDYTKLRAIIGDPSDNIPHLFRGVGGKTAAKWINNGLNPALPKWELNPVKVRQDSVWGKYSVKERWSEIYRNYIASQIVRHGDDELLSKKVREDLNQILPKLAKGYLCADKRQRTDANWHWLTDYLLKYDMAELYGRRQELWALL